MKLKYVFVGLGLAIAMSILFGSLDFMSDSIKYCQINPDNFRCTIPYLKDFAVWFAGLFSNFMINRLIIWVAVSMPILIGFLIDAKLNQNK
jgi:hypothetical protein